MRNENFLNTPSFLRPINLEYAQWYGSDDDKRRVYVMTVPVDSWWIRDQ